MGGLVSHAASIRISRSLAHCIACVCFTQHCSDLRDRLHEGPVCFGLYMTAAHVVVQSLPVAIALVAYTCTVLCTLQHHVR